MLLFPREEIKEYKEDRAAVASIESGSRIWMMGVESSLNVFMRGWKHWMLQLPRNMQLKSCLLNLVIISVSSSSISHGT
ncbi:hypothetical protein MKX03_016512 [Papaver bracteatum]|nr:hypothetical protein MKX03_016512 [Papaver bracteatum]